jgi:hypothetical protein
MGTDYVRIKRESLETFCQQVFQSLNLSEDDPFWERGLLCDDGLGRGHVWHRDAQHSRFRRAHVSASSHV